MAGIVLKISKLIIDEHVADMLESLGYVFPEQLLNNLHAFDSYPLSNERIDSIIAGWDKLAPIDVKKSLNNKYTILNGRHRVCVSLIKEIDTIRCIVEE
jgi:hypothetical protein